MPNGHPDHLENIRRTSRFWAVIWQIGDAAYYLGLLGSIILPLVILGITIRRFDSWPGLLRGLGLALVLFLGCFDTVARKPGDEIMPLWPCAGPRSCRLGPGPGSRAAGPAPTDLRSPSASAPGRPSSASSGIAGCPARPRWMWRPSVARPGTPAPSPAPATAASSARRAGERTAATGRATPPAWPAPWPSGLA